MKFIFLVFYNYFSFYLTGLKGFTVGLIFQLLIFFNARKSIFKFRFGENYLTVFFVLKHKKRRIYYRNIKKVETILSKGGYYIKIFLKDSEKNSINYSSMFPHGQYGRELTESIINLLVDKNCRVIDYSGIVK